MRIKTVVEAHARWRAWREAETVITAVMADPEVKRLGEDIRREEERLGEELRAGFQTFQDQYDRALRDADYDVLSRTCPGKHGQWGRICVLTEGHEPTDVHWGTNDQGQPVAWVGSAPDDW